WRSAVRIPAVRKMRQAVGRLIRSETDRGVAVVLDRRAGTLEGFNAELTDDPVRDILAFFGGGEKH
ncbi:MAG: helicase C-terminal domain-containing protein, partial [Methanomethylophilus sp.]|nr:helicase C-terminal domain-containing protein [Methanomethylophilus sp.]